MALQCPNYKETLSPWSLRRHFACAFCQVPLNANVVACSVIGFLVWSLFDLMALGISSLIDGGGYMVSTLAYVGVSGGFLLLILYLALANARVTRAS